MQNIGNIFAKKHTQKFTKPYKNYAIFFFKWQRYAKKCAAICEKICKTCKKKKKKMSEFILNQILEKLKIFANTITKKIFKECVKKGKNNMENKYAEICNI